MKSLKLRRINDGPYGTHGALIAGNDFIWTTLERSWEDNKPDISCIPQGKYLCARVNSPKFGSTFEVTAVDGRFAILFHKGNLANPDSHGCILLGTGYAQFNAQLGISGSGDAFKQFLDYFKDDESFELIIEGA